MRASGSRTRARAPRRPGTRRPRRRRASPAPRRSRRSSAGPLGSSLLLGLLQPQQREMALPREMERRLPLAHESVARERLEDVVDLVPPEALELAGIAAVLVLRAADDLRQHPA